jgi:predicted nuclease of predicted toxin-antitoxin system
MKLLFDENLSPKLPSRLSDLFPNSLHDLSLVYGNPPKVIWLRLRNCSTLQVENLLRRDFNAIKLFYEDENLSLLALS